MTKILKDDGAGNCYLAEIPDYSGLIGADLFSKWAIVVHAAYWDGELYPRNPMDVYQEGVCKMLQALTKDPRKVLDTQETLRSITSADDRQSIKTERENFRALQDAEHDPDTFEETLADGNTEPNEHVCQPIARQYILRILPRLEPDTKRALIAWMASGRKKENLEKAARMMHEPAQTYRDRLPGRLAEARAVCMELAKEDHQNESCW